MLRCMCGSQRTCQSLSLPLFETGSLSVIVLCYIHQALWPTSFGGPPDSTSCLGIGELRLLGVHFHAQLYVHSGDLNSGPHSHRKLFTRWASSPAQQPG